MKRPITVSSSSSSNNNNNGRSSLTRNSILNNNSSSGSNTSLLMNTSMNSTTGVNNGSIHYANTNQNNSRNTMNGNGTTFAKPTFGNPVPMINANNHSNYGGPVSGGSTFVPPVFQRPSPMSANTSTVNRPVIASTNVEPRQQFVPPKHQSFQTPQFSTPSSTQKRINNIPHSSVSTPKSGKKQPLHLVNCLSPTSTQFSTPSKSTQQQPVTPVQTHSKPSNNSSSSTNTSALFTYPSKNTSNNINNTSILNNNVNKPAVSRFVIPNNYKPQEPISRLQSSNLSDSQKENEEMEKLKNELEALKGLLNKKKLENEELVKSKKELEDQLIAAQTKIEEPHQENSMLDEVNDDFIMAVLEDIDIMKDDKSTEEASQSSQKEKEPENVVTTEEKIVKKDEKTAPVVLETVKRISKKRIKWKNKNIADLQKDPDLHKALYKLLIYKGSEDSNTMDTDEGNGAVASNDTLSGRLWKAHRTISNDQSKMYTLLPILNSYLKQANNDFDTELFMCTLETILKLVLESEIFRIAFIESFSNENKLADLITKKTIHENGYIPHPLFCSTNIVMPDSKKNTVKGKLTREKRKFLHNYLNDVAYQPDFIFDPSTDTILFNPEEVPRLLNDETKTELLSDLLAYFSKTPEYLDNRQFDILCTILEIVKTLAVWSPESALANNFSSLIEGKHLTIKTIFSCDNVVLIQKSLEVLTTLVKSEAIRSLMQQNHILTRVSAFLNVEVGTTEEMLTCRRTILRLFHYLAFLCPDGISILREKYNDNYVVFEALILLLRKELENIALLEDFSTGSERIYLIRDIIVLFNHISSMNIPIPYTPSLRLDYIYAKTTISIIREKPNFKEKFQLDEMK